MWFDWQAFSISKLGNSSEENEDAVFPNNLIGQINRPNNFRVAIADGATTTSFSSLWAKILVQETCKYPLKYLKKSIKEAQAEWQQNISQMKLPWHAEEKVKKGAHSTLLRVDFYSLHGKNYGFWKSISVGDSCLFQIRSKTMITSFPIRNSNEFNNNPYLISSKNLDNNRLGNTIFTSYGKWIRGDSFLLATDAIAKWCLEISEQGDSPIEVMPEFSADTIGAEVQYQNWISELRARNEIRNDDTTLIKLVFK